MVRQVDILLIASTIPESKTLYAPLGGKARVRNARLVKTARGRQKSHQAIRCAAGHMLLMVMQAGIPPNLVSCCKVNARMRSSLATTQAHIASFVEGLTLAHCCLLYRSPQSGCNAL